jgi:hypothetical protein
MNQFMVLQVLCVAVLLYYPQVVTRLPKVLEEKARPSSREVDRQSSKHVGRGRKSCP